MNDEVRLDLEETGQPREDQIPRTPYPYLVRGGQLDHAGFCSIDADGEGRWSVHARDLTLQVEDAREVRGARR